MSGIKEDRRETEAFLKVKDTLTKYGATSGTAKRKQGTIDLCREIAGMAATPKIPKSRRNKRAHGQAASCS